MTMVIWKEKLAPQSQQVLQLPGGSKPLHVGIQRGVAGTDVCVWFMCNPANKDFPEPHTFFAVGTGEEFVPEDFNAKYLGTIKGVRSNGDSLVVHWFHEGGR